jgi:indolepyruvate ferredoxin oxidoreductase alpha subunit
MALTQNRKTVVLGAEAVSYGAIDAGAKGVFGYPGTPSTEVFEKAEAIINELRDGRAAKWAANEKAAYEMALGASYAGNRSIVTMKHVGLNVAMDAFVNSALTGVHGGLVVVVADDPSMHSSQNEQDSRVLAEFSLIPTLEPATLQEVYDYTQQAFEISERFHIPVLLRLVTRLSHARGFIDRKEPQPIKHLSPVPVAQTEGWVLVPSRAKTAYKRLRDKSGDIIRGLTEYNRLTRGASDKVIVASGMGRAYLKQHMTEHPGLATEYSVLEIGGYPVLDETLSSLTGQYKEILVVEENYPHIEDKLRLLVNATDCKVRGRRDGALPLVGEITMASLAGSLQLPLPEAKPASPMTPTPRLPRLCDGCGHRDAFKAMKEAADNLGFENLRFYGDIGCYTLGAYPPFDAIHTTVEMGASQGMAIGAALMGSGPAVAILGDSTFFHSGLPNLVVLAGSGVNAKLVIMDNRTVGMTGQQEPVAVDIIPSIVRAVGFKDEQIHQMVPLPKNHEENVKTFEKILQHHGADVVIFKRECIQSLKAKR